MDTRDPKIPLGLASVLPTFPWPQRSHGQAGHQLVIRRESGVFPGEAKPVPWAGQDGLTSLAEQPLLGPL